MNSYIKLYFICHQKKLKFEKKFYVIFFYYFKNKPNCEMPKLYYIKYENTNDK